MDFLPVWSWFAAVLGTAPQAFSRDAGMRDATFCRSYLFRLRLCIVFILDLMICGRSCAPVVSLRRLGPLVSRLLGGRPFALD